MSANLSAQPISDAELRCLREIVAHSNAEVPAPSVRALLRHIAWLEMRLTNGKPVVVPFPKRETPT